MTTVGGWQLDFVSQLWRIENLVLGPYSTSHTIYTFLLEFGQFSFHILQLEETQIHNIKWNILNMVAYYLYTYNVIMSMTNREKDLKLQVRVCSGEVSVSV